MTEEQYQCARNALYEIRSFDFSLRNALNRIEVPFSLAESIILKLGYLENRAAELDQMFPLRPSTTQTEDSE